jgi:hypothetical protein
MTPSVAAAPAAVESTPAPDLAEVATDVVEGGFMAGVSAGVGGEFATSESATLFWTGLGDLGDEISADWAASHGRMTISQLIAGPWNDYSCVRLRRSGSYGGLGRRIPSIRRGRPRICKSSTRRQRIIHKHLD